MDQTTKVNSKTKEEKVKTLILICQVILIIMVGVLFFKINKNYDSLDSINFKSKFDSLTLLVDSLRNERVLIQTRIEKESDTIKVIEKHYEKVIDRVSALPADSQCVIFPGILSEAFERFLNDYYSDSIETN